MRSSPGSAAQPCSECGTGLLEVVYGMPSSELFEASERGEVVLGGCVLPVGGDVERRCQCGRLNDRAEPQER